MFYTATFRNQSYSNETFKVQYCSRGCSYYEQAYAMAILAADPKTAPIRLGLPTSSSIVIQWEGSSNSEVFYNVQWQYAEIDGSRWSTFDSTFETEMNVTGLMPFTSYIFRVQWVVFSPAYTALTPESEKLQTEANGPPIDAPVITNLISPSATTILVEWSGVQFPAGPIVGHDLSIESSTLVRMPVGPNVFSHVFTDQLPNTTYNISVAARNSFGSGPLRAQSVTTLEAQSDNSTTPYLVVSVERSRFSPPFAPVSAVELLPIPYEELEISKTIHLISNESSKILDVAVHYDKSFLFFIDEMGTIHRKNISDLSTAVNETSTEEILVGSSTTRIDVDWLYDEIYYIEGVNINKCSIDGTGVTLAVGPLDDAPTELTVDPFNGYLFWADSTGIFRLDLQDVRNGNFDMKERILEITNASAFTVDPSSYEIFFSSPLMQTIGKAQLDGSEMVDERPSDSRHENLTNLERYGGLFHWTEETEDKGPCSLNGMITEADSLLFESLKKEVIEVTEYGGFFCVHGYGGLDILHPSAQPFPVPLVAPQGLQVLFDVTSAQLSWQPVKRLESKGKGAWDRWSYEVEITTVQSGKVDEIDVGVGITLYKVPELDADTDYIFRVRALSQAGNGPWSAQFGGRTFTATTPEAFILMATNSSVVKTGLDGDNVENLHVLDDNIIDLAWTQDYAFWVHGNGQEMFSLSLVDSGSTPRPLAGHTSTSIRALAVDWIGGKMYWSDNDRNEISRADLNLDESTLSNQEVIVEFRSVRDLALDSVNGYIYWTEERRIEAARLNGQEVETISEYSDFADEEIAGLTLDFVSGKVFWFVIGSSNGNSEFQLFNADLRHISKNPPSGPQVINSNTMQATLHFFSDKLFWVDTGNRLVIQQLSREELSFIPSDPVYEVTVVQNSTLQPYPDGFNKAPNVRPNTINPTDIVIASGGVWDNFTVKWSDSPEVDHDVVWYRVLITSADSSYRYDTVQRENEVRITELEPFIGITVEVSAFTYWHVSAAADQMLTSPMAAPTVPQNERLFINEDYDIMTGESEFTAVFRWEKELDTNGILDKYIVYWGTDRNSLVGEDVASTTFEFTRTLSTTDTYFFQVAGVTQGGTGVETPLLSGSKNVPTFPPTFLSPIDDGYNIVDSDTGELFNLINEDQPQQNSVTLDWISLRLYYAVGTSIYMFDLTKEETVLGVEREPLAVSVNGDIEGLVISPNDNLLIWSEVDATLGTTLKSYQLNGPGQIRRKRQSDVSSCNISIAGAFALDTSNSSRSRLYYVEKDSNNIWVSDSNGCNGNIFFNSSTQTQSGLPATYMTVDQDKLYWTNSTLQTLASIDKATGENFQIEDSDTTVLIATGRHLQPYPDPDCLIPAGPITEPSLTEAFANSLHLQIEPVSTNSICGSVSLAAPVYTVLYASNCSGFDEGDSVETTDLTVILDNFEPYTDYCLLLMVANKYTSDDQSSNLTSDPVTYKTWVGDNAKSVNKEFGASEGTTFERPTTIYRDSGTHYSIEVCWTSAGDGSIQKYRLEHRFINSPVSDESEESAFTTGPEEQVTPEPALEYCTTIGSVTEPLRPYSTYEIQLQAQYTSGIWYNNAVSPSDIMIDEMTEGDAPGVITDLEVENDVVSWSQPERRGPGTLNYTLEAKEISEGANVAKRATGDWQQVYTGTKTTWTINLEEDVMFVYRVAASNDVGTGSFSPDSEPYTKLPVNPGSNIGIIIGAVGMGVVILVLLILVICCVIRRKEEKNRNFGGPVTYHADTELATLRDYPTTMEGNQLYALTTTADGKEAKLPLFARERLKLLTFLGSGAFGEVFEGWH
ncbi:putative proto-oncogene tyrosine-protein kinase ROS [Apostichopus japonicus]|uniref:Putative proto-oncogene tyrosine-protein kinase ROS n=1 Tax=Stichopus japonicus TaxID=307972 RepID=A0A2G8KJ12_STIJA|nr:putative proto-oncogene tyrosine-protein kinase ROS [Apostichopus japonicus]